MFEIEDLNDKEKIFISNFIQSTNDKKMSDERATNVLIAGLRKLSLEQSLSKKGYSLLEKLQREEWSNELHWLHFLG
ncbi:hypothetical protein [Leuconostoc gelidum]|uniref:hypothetical protein n=1 Tax=Leuconostoc gelidum TaxID=1244 RepID=UPI001CC677C5|nr:hypothetical protein [Leuconostoc gelidum]